jgi:hypothetical protein
MLFNAAAILNEQRFLEKCTICFILCLDLDSVLLFSLFTAPPPSHHRLLSFLLNSTDGWGFSQLGSRPVGEGPGALKHQIIGTLHAATYMRGKLSRKEENNFANCRALPLTHQPPSSFSFLSFIAVPLIGFNIVVIFLKVIIG